MTAKKILSYKNLIHCIASNKSLQTIHRTKKFLISKQVLRSATSFVKNVHEAVVSESKKDFVQKIRIAVKEATETSYWLRLLKDSNFISFEQFNILNNNCNELLKILNSIILTTKERYFKTFKIHNYQFKIYKHAKNN